LIEVGYQLFNPLHSLFFFGGFALVFLFDFDPGDGVLPEDIHGLGHIANFVLATAERDLKVDIATGETFHDTGNVNGRPCDAARNPDGDSNGDHQAHDS